MPSDPKRKVDELLNSYVRTRRTGVRAQFELTQRSRERLQTEIARTYPRSSPASPTWFASIPLLWRRIAWAGGLAGLMLILAVAWWRSEQLSPRFATARQDRLDLFAKDLTSPVRGKAKEIESNSIADRLGSFQLGLVQHGNEGIAAAAPRPSVLPGIVGNESRGASSRANLGRQQAERAARLQVAMSEERPKGGLEADSASNAAHWQFTLPSTTAVVSGAKLALAMPPATPPGPDNQSATQPPSVALLNASSVRQFGMEPEAKGQSPSAHAKTSFANQIDAKSGELKQQDLALAYVPTASRFSESMPARPGSSTQLPQLAALPSQPAENSTRRASVEGSSAPLFFQKIDPDTRYRRNLNSPPTPSILSNFELQRMGQRIRVLDRDGSLYEGAIDEVKSEIQAASALLSEGTASLPDAAAARALRSDLQQSTSALSQVGSKFILHGEAPAQLSRNGALSEKMNSSQAVNVPLKNNDSSQAFSFRVAGTNQTLNQFVIVTGEYLPLVGNQALTPANKMVDYQYKGQNGIAGQGGAARSVGANELPLKRQGIEPTVADPTNSLVGVPARINGRAQIGEKSQFNFEAEQIER